MIRIGEPHSVHEGTNTEPLVSQIHHSSRAPTLGTAWRRLDDGGRLDPPLKAYLSIFILSNTSRAKQKSLAQVLVSEQSAPAHKRSDQKRSAVLNFQWPHEG